MSVLKDHIFRLGLDVGIPSRVISVEADAYLCPEPRWITEQFGPEFQDFIQRNGITFRDGQFVCRDFALLAVAMAKLVWFKTAPRDDTLAIGMIGLLDREHKQTCAVHRNADQSLRLAVYEPQERMIEISVMPGELRRCGAFQFL